MIPMTPEDLLTDLFGIAIGRIGFFNGSLLSNRKCIGFTIYSTGGRKNNIGHTVFFHGFQQMDQRKQIVFIICQGFLHTFPHSFESCKMNDCFYVGVFFKYPIG